MVVHFYYGFISTDLRRLPILHVPSRLLCKSRILGRTVVANKREPRGNLELVTIRFDCLLCRWGFIGLNAVIIYCYQIKVIINETVLFRK